MSQNRLANRIETGLRHQKAGRLEEAAKNYRQVLSEDPKQPDALHLLGVIAQNIGQLDEAVELISESLRYNPGNVSAINNLAGVLKDQRRYPEAIEFYQAALAAAPEEAYIHSNLGNAWKDSGRLDEAIAAYEQALKLSPDSYSALSNLGTAYKELGQRVAAMECCRRALALNPEAHEVHVNLGVLLKEQGKFAEAIHHFEEALRLHPRADAAYTNMGSALKESGRVAEALVSFWRALEINPKSHFALNNLGNTLKEQGRFAEAVGCFEKALEIEPASHLALNNLGSAFCELGRSAEALDFFRRALKENPDYHPALSNLLFTLNYLPGFDREVLFAEHLRFEAQFGQRFRDIISIHPNAPDPARRLRVGFVSGDFREHSVAHFIAPVFAHHTAAEFEIFCYSNHFVHDVVSERLRLQVEQWREVAPLTDNELADLIRQDRIDILVDLSGHTARNRLLVFARKPAPIQVTMIGYMQTTGLSAMDYRITDEKIDPTGVSDPFNIEQLVRLAHGAATFQPPAECPPVNDLPALRHGWVTFASFNNLAKVTPEALASWARILHSLPTAKLLLVGRAGHSIAEQFEEHGIARSRLRFLDRMPMADFLALHHEVDFLLDTFPYNGGTTSLLAAWMGVPLVTLAGPDAAGRTGASLLTALGLEELIATDADDYVRRAVGAVRDLPRLAGWRAMLRGRLEPLLGGGAGFTVEFEAALREMWCKWCATKC